MKRKAKCHNVVETTVNYVVISCAITLDDF